MTLDLSLYEANKAFVQSWYTGKSNRDIKTAISMMSIATCVPAIVIAYWLGEITSWNDDIIHAISRLKDFYGYTEILNKPPGAPI